MIAIISANDHEHPFLTYPVKSIFSPVYQRKLTSPGWLFPTEFFLLSFVSLIKPKRGDRPYIFTGMKPLKTRFFVNGNYNFYFFASFNQI